MSGSLQSRALVVCLGLVLGLSGLSARLIHLQWFDRRESVRKASQSHTRKLPLPAERGLIVDRNEDVLAWNLPVTTVKVDKKHLSDPRVVAFGVAYSQLAGKPEFEEATAHDRRRMVMGERYRLLESVPPHQIVERHFKLAVAVLSRHLRIPKAEIRARIEGSSLMDLTLAKDLREDLADDLEEAVRQNYLQGFRFEKSSRRWYSSSKLATHSIGFVDHEGKGQMGVERVLNQYLSGKDGYRILKRDPRGLLLAPNEGKVKPPIAGFNVQLSLDMGLQSIVEEELDAALVEYKSEKAAIIFADPKTGDILAMASRPHFDLNVREGVEDASFHFAVQAIYEPGSTFKVVGTSAALDMGLANLDTTIFCHWGNLREGRFSVPDHHPYGDLTFRQVLAKSSNIGTYKLSKMVTPPRFVDYAKGFGFSQKTGIVSGAEESGLFADWGNAVNFSRMAFGYGVSVTPLQVTMAYCALANGGELMKPRLVTGVIANDGTLVERFDPEVRGRAVKESTARRMREALTTVVSPKGTARRAAVPGFKVAGKTGTAKKFNPAGGYYDNRYVCSFAGMLPAENPAFVCVVVIDDPNIDDPETEEFERPGGGSVAAPVFAKIAARAAAHLSLAPTEPIEEGETLAGTE